MNNKLKKLRAHQKKYKYENSITTSVKQHPEVLSESEIDIYMSYMDIGVQAIIDYSEGKITKEQKEELLDFSFKGIKGVRITVEKRLEENERTS